MKLWEGLEEERDQANRVKRKSKILVVLGNPPYNAFAGVQAEEEGSSVEVYKEGLVSKWKIRKFNLDELYVRFLRLAERKIIDQVGRGIVCYISNASYAADKSFVVLRERFLREFDSITIDNCNGDSRETGKLTPDGKPDPSIFSTKLNREGIRVGTAVGLFVKTGKKRKGKTGPAIVRWRDFWGETKRRDLLESLHESGAGYTTVVPSEGAFHSFKPLASTAAYQSWPRVVDLCESEPISGLAEKRKGGLISIDRAPLEQRLSAYFDTAHTWPQVAAKIGRLAQDAGRYPAAKTRQKLLSQGERFSDDNLRRYAFLPLDNRWCYHTSSRPLWNEPRPALAEHFWSGNRALVFRTSARQRHEGRPAYAVTALPDHHLLDPNVVAIPLRLRAKLLDKTTTTGNLGVRARAYLSELGIADPDANETEATLIWYHALAVCYSPAWLAENGPAILADFPRVPLPSRREILERSAALGRRIADLLDPEVQVQGVTTGKMRDELLPFGALRCADGRAQIDPSSGDLAVTARWGVLQRDTIVMPGPGRVTEAAEPLSNGTLGPRVVDVWLNGAVYVHAIPERVWDFTIGGYQVLKKWLSYREKSILGRDLILDEARHLTGMVRRIAAVLLLGPELDKAYQDARDQHTWPAMEGELRVAEAIPQNEAREQRRGAASRNRQG